MSTNQPKYHVDLSAITGHSIPPLLASFGAWLSSQDYGSLGWFALRTEAVAAEWYPGGISNIQSKAFSFLRLPDGSLLLLVDTGEGSPSAVALSGSEGETDSVATSLEEFLMLLSRGETGIADLDLAEAPARTQLKAWLMENKVAAPKASPFDFDGFLDGTLHVPVPTGPRASGLVDDSFLRLAPLVRQVAAMVGRRADDAELVEFITGTLGQKIPNSTTDASASKHVVAKRYGLELLFSHDVKNMKYPPVFKSKRSYLPYLELAWLYPTLPDALPFGLKFGMSAEEITDVLGEPAGLIGSLSLRRPYWQRSLDPERDLVFRADAKMFAIQIDEAQALTSPWESPPLVGLLVAWLANRGLLEPAAFSQHSALLDAVGRRKQRGSDLVDAALARGLWDIHLKDLPGIRHFAFEWMHNIGGKFIRDDLVSVFGSRLGPHGHAEALLDDDDWAAVDRATPVLDRRFADWQG